MCDFDGSGLRSPRGSRSVLFWLVVFSIFLLAVVCRSYGSEQSEQLQNIELRLSRLVEKSARLEQECRTWNDSLSKSEQQARQLLADLQMQSSELEKLRNELTFWQAVSLALDDKVQELLGSLAILQRMYEELGRTFDATVAGWSLALKKAEKQSRRLKVLGLSGTVLGLVAGGVLGWVITK